MAGLVAKRALIADDDPIYRETGAESLKDGEFEVVMAENGAAAMAALTTQPFDIALIDLSMPDMSGLEVIRAQRRGGANMATPSVVITGHDDAASVREAFDAGATSYLTKPLNLVLFLPHVEFVMRNARLERELRDAMEATEFLGDLKTKLMHGLAQEFQDPIKTMFGFVELMRREVYGPVGSAEYKGFVNDMGRALGLLNTALVKLLDSGRGLKQHLALRDDSIDVAALLTDAVAGQTEVAMSRGVMVDTNMRIAPELSVRGDRALMAQVIRTLVEGAVRSAPRGSRMALEAAADASGGITISTLDTGEPFSASLVSEINGDIAAKAPGHSQRFNRNLGLKVAKILAEAHQSAIALETGGRSGNRCRLTIPRSRVRRAVVQPPDGGEAAKRFGTALNAGQADVFASSRLKDPAA